MFAANHFDVDTFREQVVNCTNSDGYTPLHIVASEGHFQLIDTLVQHGAEVDARNDSFRTPLHIACLRGFLNVIQSLIQRKADINAKDSENNTPTHFCAMYGHRHCLRFLASRQPYLLARNNEGRTPVDVAASKELLLEFKIGKSGPNTGIIMPSNASLKLIKQVEAKSKKLAKEGAVETARIRIRGRSPPPPSTPVKNKEKKEPNFCCLPDEPVIEHVSPKNLITYRSYG